MIDWGYKSTARWMLLLGSMLVYMVACNSGVSVRGERIYSFKLVGGHFFGPGPIVPDTALPEGELRNIKFDLKRFYGYAEFESSNDESAYLSDGKTRINQNIDAGRLDIGGGENPVWLVAVNGGRNKGREYYRLDHQYQFVWTVDIALDPGFADGIIRVDDFVLTTGIVEIDLSAQTEEGMPGGYDQAGTLASGQYLAGRVGDFDNDGYMDGIVVAAPRVPLESNMLPGAPVGNQRGFVTDVEIPAHMAGELTLGGISLFRDPLHKLIKKDDAASALALIRDIILRFEAAQNNLQHALADDGYWSEQRMVGEGNAVLLEILNAKVIAEESVSLLDSYRDTQISDDVIVKKFNTLFTRLDILLDRVNSLNEKTGMALPLDRIAKIKSSI